VVGVCIVARIGDIDVGDGVKGLDIGRFTHEQGFVKNVNETAAVVVVFVASRLARREGDAFSIVQRDDRAEIKDKFGLRAERIVVRNGHCF